MSQSATLISYQTDAAGRLYEPGGEVIETAFISPYFINLLTDNSLVKTQLLYEEIGEEDASELMCVDEDGLVRFLELLEFELIRVLESEETLRLVNLVVREEMELIMGELRTIANLYHIVKLKLDKFGSTPYAVIKIG